MGISKSPRPTDESNLMQLQYRGQDRGGWSNSLLALAVRRSGVLQPACVFHGDIVALLRLVLAVAGRNLSLRDAHCERLYGLTVSLFAVCEVEERKLEVRDGECLDRKFLITVSQGRFDRGSRADGGGTILFGRRPPDNLTRGLRAPCKPLHHRMLRLARPGSSPCSADNARVVVFVPCAMMQRASPAPRWGGGGASHTMRHGSDEVWVSSSAPRPNEIAKEFYVRIGNNGQQAGGVAFCAEFARC